MIIAVHQPQYLPWLGYFDKIKKSDCFVFLDRVEYKQREFQNRNKIRTKDGWIWLTVPVMSKGMGRQLVSDTRIESGSDWQKRHWRSLNAWYGRAEFFDHYASFFEEIYVGMKWDRLADLNIFIIKYLAKELGIETPFYLESDIGTTKSSTDRIVEICKKLKADTYLSGTGGKAYLEEAKFDEEGLVLRYQSFEHPAYNQCFNGDANGFVCN
ncbi:MAG: WbqC family protein, partial [Candidatus Omnitrophica bacterium]|nr:WbqC family protein [Candidatus Omnitrophota bacterium]